MTDTPLAGLSILCLAYNEEENIAWAIPILCSLGSSYAYSYEIVVITSSESTDNTNAILADFMSKNSSIRAVNQPRGTRGYGPAFAFGIQQTSKEFTFHVDIDGQFPLEDLKRLIDLQRRHDLDVVHFDRLRRQDSWERKLIGLCFKLLVHSFYKCPVWDFDSAFNLFRTSSLREVRLLSTSGMAVPELMIQLGVAQARFGTGSVRHQPRRAGSATWEVKRLITLPDTGVVLANLKDIWKLRHLPGGRLAPKSRTRDLRT